MNIRYLEQVLAFFTGKIYNFCGIIYFLAYSNFHKLLIKHKRHEIDKDLLKLKENQSVVAYWFVCVENKLTLSNKSIVSMY